MTRPIALALASIALGMARPAPAQTYMTPDGPIKFYYTTPEWRQAGGNPIIYRQLVEQKLRAAHEKAMRPQYEAMLKQQKAFEKWLADQEAKKEKGKPVDPAYQRMLDEEARIQAAIEAQVAKAAARKMKRSPAAKKAAAKKPDEAAKVEETKKAAEAEKADGGGAKVPKPAEKSGGDGPK